MAPEIHRPFYKSFATDDHAELLTAAGGKAFQFFERNSRPGQFTKSASEVIPKKVIQEYMPPDTHFGVHLITMGEEETFGPNRNGDSASQESLRKHHGTFEKFAHVYREHKNRNPKTQGVGQVKLAKVNPSMHRGELIVWVEKDKAPDMYKAAKAGEELSWSMSMRLPHDECSVCRNKSRTRADYCGHLRDHMLQWVPGMRKFAYARNEDDVKFFDISEVKRRADRIATYLGYTFSEDTLAKAASEGGPVISGAEWGEYYNDGLIVVPFDPWEDTTLEKLASAQEFVARADEDTRIALAAMAPQNLTQEQIEVLAEGDFRSVGGELAKRAMVVNFPTFASLVTGQSIEDLEKNASFCDVANFKLPSLFGDLMHAGGSCCGDEVASSVAPDEAGCMFSSSKDNIDRLMREVGGNLSMDPGESKDRVMRMTIIKAAAAPVNAEPPAEFDPYFEGMAEAYGHYVVKAAHSIKDLPEINPHTLFRSIAASILTRVG